jgi:3-hydroxyacyl-[acyl-carrier-protein] dehydratase
MASTEGGTLEIEEIISLIPHRHPFLLVDRVLAWTLEPEKTIRALKNVTVNEPFFPGHFPDNPVMPGVLVIEAMAQAAGVLAGLFQRSKGLGNDLYYLVKVDKARFSKIVVPGDQLILSARQKRRVRNMGLFECSAEVEGKPVARCELLCAGRS